MITCCKNWGIQGNSAKSTNNPMSSFGLIEKNLELSHIYQALRIPSDIEPPLMAFY